MNPLDHFQISAADWRRSLQRNTRRTRTVIIIFVLTYTLLGVAVDPVGYHMLYPLAPLPIIVQALLHGQLFPLGSVVFLKSLFFRYS